MSQRISRGDRRGRKKACRTARADGSRRRIEDPKIRRGFCWADRSARDPPPSSLASNTLLVCLRFFAPSILRVQAVGSVLVSEGETRKENLWSLDPIAVGQRPSLIEESSKREDGLQHRHPAVQPCAMWSVGCPKADVVNNAPDVNASTTGSVMDARCRDM